MTAENQPPSPNDPQDPNAPAPGSPPSETRSSGRDPFSKTEEEWQRLLAPEEFRVLRQHGTEPSFHNRHWNRKDKGLYLCAGCEAPLFASAEKYDSGTGWPSFWDSIAPEYVGRAVDQSGGMTRTEVHCQRCGGHLGHLFDDGPKPTGLRYCINGVALEFDPETEKCKGDEEANAMLKPEYREPYTVPEVV